MSSIITTEQHVRSTIESGDKNAIEEDILQKMSTRAVWCTELHIATRVD